VGWEWPDIEPEDPVVTAEIMIDRLEREVGGEDALREIDVDPLPDEEFRWDRIPDDVRPAVQEVLARCDSCCEELLDTEYRTACRRLLARAAAGDPRVFRRRAKAENAAVAVCWVIGKANNLFAPYGTGMLVKDLAAFFGVAQSSASQRAATLMNAAGVGSLTHYPTWDVVVGTPSLLVSARRRVIVELRDHYLQEL
jgi:hypothetical protein